MRPLAAAVFVCAMLPAIAGSAAEREVTADEAPIRSAPFDIAPEIARARAGDRLPADDQPQGVWRRVRLPDGRFGFLRDADAREAPPLPVAAPAPAPASQVGDAATVDIAPATTAAPAPVAQLRAPAPVNDAPKSGPSLFGVIFEILPAGTLMASESNGTTRLDRSADSQFAVAVAPALDIPASPYFAVGFSPKVVFRVASKDSQAIRSATEFDFRFRLTGRVPLSPSTRAYGRVSPGYSLISVPYSDGQDPMGFIVDTSVGVEVALLPRLFAIVDLGYQYGFQSRTDPTDNSSFDGTRYLHLGGGLAIGL